MKLTLPFSLILYDFDKKRVRISYQRMGYCTKSYEGKYMYGKKIFE